DTYMFDSKYNGHPAGGVAIKLATGANALDTAQAVEERLQELRQNYPTGLKDEIAFDTTPFIKLSIESVVHTLIEAIVLYNGHPAGGVAIKLATGANALDTAQAVEERLQELRQNYPTGLKDEIAFDTTPFIKLSIESVVHTLIEAIVLVFIVMFLFLQNWRATIIPTLAVPVVVLGTF
ncbi:hypothetical protein GWI33_011084, partial [Rhynchophorus ferrugineus]